MEHLNRFGLKQDPFCNEPQLEYYFEGAGHAEVRQRLARCLHQGKELCLLVGEVGSGTSTLARALLEDLDPERFEAGMLVVARGVEPAWLRAAIARQLGVEAPSAERAEGVRQLYHRLVEIQAEGRRAVIAIDEAQALAGSEALAELAALLHFEHDEKRLLSAVLVGPPELERALARDPGLLGRVELRVRLEPLSPIEARAYLAHRIRVAGGDPAILSPGVMDAIAVRAAGLPRRMNALADNALFEAHLARRERAALADVERAARDLPWAEVPGDSFGGAASSRADSDYGAALAADPNEDTLGGGEGERARSQDSAGSDGLDELGLAPLEGDPGEDTDEELERVFAEAASPARAPRRPLPAGMPELERTARTHGMDLDRGSLSSPEPTPPSDWRPAPAPRPTRTLGPPIPDDKELDDLFVDLVEEA